MKHYLFASLTIVALFVLAWADAPAWLNLGIAGLLLTPLVFHVDDLKRQIEVLEWSIEGSDELVSDLEAMIDRRNSEISEFHKSGVRFDEFLKADNASLAKENKELRHENKTLRDIAFQFDERFLRDVNLWRDLQEEVDRAKKVFTYPKITPQTTDQQHFELVRMSVEGKLDWMSFIISKFQETPSQREDREIQREQESVYNNGLGL